VNIDVFDRLAAANPMRVGATKPESIMSATALRDVIDDRRRTMQTQDIQKVVPTELEPLTTQKAPTSQRRKWIPALAAAAAVLILIGGVGLLTRTTVTTTPTALEDSVGKIVFHSARDGHLEVYVMDADGSNPTRLTDNPAYDGDPAWSPVG